MTDPALEVCRVDPELEAELPGLGLWTTAVHASPGPSPAGVRERLRRMAERITGGHVVHMRQDPVPWAYRVLWRQVGLDPDVDRPPAERLAVERLRAGEIRSLNRLDDALTVATLETGVPVVAFDAALVQTPLELRLDRGRIVIADAAGPVATLDGQVDEERGVTRATTDMVLASIQARGVPPISVEEALWTAVDVLCTPA
jgi:DNA/RNA-binding domain of Phe-tRNA-synthetase-like protein